MRHPSHAGTFRSPWLVTLVAALVAAVFASMATAVDIPTDTSASPAPAAPPVPDTAAAPQPAPAPALKAVPVTLRTGSFGAIVRDLQRELRRRGQRYVKVDGAFGPATRRAVRAVQRRLGLRPTGVASPAFLKRLGIQTSRSAAGGTPVPVGLTQPLPLGAKYLRAFPVLGTYTYTDDFGAPRHQGRHEGTDVMADRGSPLVAVADGSIKRLTRTETGLGGIYIWLQDTAGNEYYYAHMDTIAAGLDAGSAVRVGQVIGTVGNTGDARYGATHLHFEIHPGGGEPVNPYTELVAVDPARGR